MLANFHIMQYFLTGFPDPTWSSRELERRKRLILQDVQGDTAQSMWQSITDLAGDVRTSDGRVRWPYAVVELLSKKHLCMRDRLIWSGFCYQNGVPFGLMISYPHACRTLRDEAAYFDLMNSWCSAKRSMLDSMVNLMTYDRYVASMGQRGRDRT